MQAFDAGQASGSSGILRQQPLISASRSGPAGAVMAAMQAFVFWTALESQSMAQALPPVELLVPPVEPPLEEDVLPHGSVGHLGQLAGQQAVTNNATAASRMVTR
jgi:hypothetical protein